MIREHGSGMRVHAFYDSLSENVICNKIPSYYINVVRLVQESARLSFLCYAFSERRAEPMKVKEYAKKDIEQIIAKIAKKSAGVEANTACPCWGYQPKEPKQVKALRKF